MNHTWEPYVRVGMITARKIFHQERKEIPLTELPMTVSARMVLRAQLARVVTWIFQLRVGVKKTPRYLIWLAMCRVRGGRVVNIGAVTAKTATPQTQATLVQVEGFKRRVENRSSPTRPKRVHTIESAGLFCNLQSSLTGSLEVWIAPGSR